MNGTEFRVLDTISRRVNDPVSIRQLTAVMEGSGPAYYPNVYRALLSLQKEGIITMEKQGKASVTTLNFANYLLLDTLTEMEIQKKRNLLRKWPHSWPLLEGLERELGDLPSVESILLLDPQRNAKLNRVEPLVLVEEKDKSLEGKVEKAARETGARFSVRVEPLVVAGAVLIERLKSPEKNPFKEILSDMLVFYTPQKFWKLIRDAMIHGVRIRFDPDRTDPSRIGEKDLAFNLTRLGYREIGTESERGRDFCVEYIISSMLLGEDKRRTAAVPVLLAKNKVDYSLLVFLSRRHGFAERLLGVLVALIKVAPSREVGHAVATMSGAGISPAKMDEAHIRQTLRLYGSGAR